MTEKQGGESVWLLLSIAFAVAQFHACSQLDTLCDVVSNTNALPRNYAISVAHAVIRHVSVIEFWETIQSKWNSLSRCWEFHTWQSRENTEGKLWSKPDTIIQLRIKNSFLNKVTRKWFQIQFGEIKFSLHLWKRSGSDSSGLFDARRSISHSSPRESQSRDDRSIGEIRSFLFLATTQIGHSVTC